MSKLKKTGKIILGFATPVALLAGYYVVDRMFIKKVPLFPLSLKKAKEKKANSAMGTAKKKLEGMIQSGEINGFGTVYNEKDYGKNYVIEISASNVTPDLKNKLPKDVNGVEIKWVEASMTKAQ